MVARLSHGSASDDAVAVGSGRVGRIRFAAMDDREEARSAEHEDDGGGLRTLEIPFKIAPRPIGSRQNSVMYKTMPVAHQEEPARSPC